MRNTENDIRSGSILFNFRKSLGQGLILSGGLKNSLTVETQKNIAARLSGSEEYKKLTTISEQLNLELRKDKVSFETKYGAQRQNGQFKNQFLGLSGAYTNKNLNLDAGATFTGKNLLPTAVQAQIGYDVKNVCLSGSVVYDATTKKFMPKFSITAKL